MKIDTSFINLFLSSFDWIYIFTVNILAYVLIKILEEISSKKTKQSIKYLITFCAGSFIGGILYYIEKDKDLVTLIYSFLLSLISYDYIFKSLLVKVKKGYN